MGNDRISDVTSPMVDNDLDAINTVHCSSLKPMISKENLNEKIKIDNNEKIKKNMCQTDALKKITENSKPIENRQGKLSENSVRRNRENSEIRRKENLCQKKIIQYLNDEPRKNDENS